jgi:ectoine hydroxylase-related dioxygenase (phytanoyl-CoA dioxygenase family)
MGRYVEELRNTGYCVIPDALLTEELETARQRLDATYQIQVRERGVAFLESIQERDLARMPFAQDDWFLKLVMHEKVLHLVRSVLGEYVILHLQNGILNQPDNRHHQSSWHRDLPYQDWTSSKPLAVSALHCLDDFTHETGGTQVLPHSHRFEKFPSDSYVNRFQSQIEAPAGSVILFDSMLYHRAGNNTSGRIRRGINHVYTIPLLKQQIDIPAALKGAYADDPVLSRLLGYSSAPPHSVRDWREIRCRKLHSQPV